MNFIKTTIATAAVITCCLGNDYPAKAHSHEPWTAGYDYGFLYGWVSSACFHYRHGDISRTDLRGELAALRDQDDATPAIKSRIVRNIEKGAEQGQVIAKSCLPDVRQIFGSNSNRSYNSADYVY